MDPISAEEIDKRIANAVATKLVSGEKQELVRKGRGAIFSSAS